MAHTAAERKTASITTSSPVSVARRMTMQDVRAAYRDLRDRCLADVRDPAWGSSAYINALWSTWDEQLSRHPQDVELDEVADLTRAQAESDDVLEWLDAYPDAVTDRLPGGLFNPVSV